jgi:lipoprotein-anchoring transpeptidase ErfK/SrfK
MNMTARHKFLITLCIAGVVLIVLDLIVGSSPAARSVVPDLVSSTGASSTAEKNTPSQVVLSEYIEVTDSCGPYYEGVCVNMRSGPGTTYSVVMQLRNGMVLKVASTTIGADGRTWYKIGFDGEIHYPERVTSDWYVVADYVRLFSDAGESKTVNEVDASSTKRIVIDLAKEMLYAYDGDTLFMQQAISTGLELTPTPIGTFWVHRKMPDSYMQGPIPGLSDQYYDLPGVPWDLYFTKDGAAIHGAYWHNHFGEPWSHGCVNLPPDQAKLLYEWADLGTPVIVQN